LSLLSTYFSKGDHCLLLTAFDSRADAKSMAVRMPDVAFPDSPGFISRWPGNGEAMLKGAGVGGIDFGRGC